ncbi:hypothetical protein I6H42_01590 [Schaalia meyeri]|uniref:Uncharacterized protein n=1 Tax=Schaalia meyeri TaxID=52773 RepID=A0AAQ0BX68_9ACTO|nr:hypothetical protein [Schaalia meyeri]QQC44142.1 hypothetical protein I6H42_01590 [Schaalia meyeri]
MSGEFSRKTKEKSSSKNPLYPKEMRRMEGDLAQGEFSFFIFAMVASERTGTSASTMDEARAGDCG